MVKKFKKVNKVIQKYLELRAELDARRKEFNEFEKTQKDKLERLSMWLKEFADETGQETIGTKYGTAYRVTKDYVRVKDWDEVLKFIQETDNWQMLEKRIGKIATKEIMEDIGEVPPGVDYSQDIEFQVRKPTK